ncbi:hypothetical protein [Synechococcus sp. 1G10]|uniref:hypothetical protein n=1 Tax=Synechococcus sp. 1G10 TaxID=2025605 RepID=UPI00117CF769|nr:hypothetical protein [Synechococcus sp. 1G10]
MTTTSTALAVGSISAGTLRPDQLADSFLGTIDDLRIADRAPDGLIDRAQLLACSASSPVAPELPDDASEIIEELIELLDGAANPGWFFGSHPGDGADFGFWPIDDDDQEPPTLRQMLEDAGSRWVDTNWSAPNNAAIDDIIERFDDCPESLQDFDHSDWVNLAECYTRDLLARWGRQEDSIRALFDAYCEAIGCTSTLEALEGQTIDDPDDFTAAYVNLAMSWGAQELCREIYPDR